VRAETAVIDKSNSSSAKTEASQRELFIVNLLVNYRWLAINKLTALIINGDDINTNTQQPDVINLNKS
jgi:hypothetical protein